jgi:zinc and cadmium transporter
MATAFLHLLPEAFESQAGAKDLFLTLLLGLVFFFLLDKAELWHHGHEHHHHGADHAHAHDHDHDHTPPQPGSWAILTGDSVHCFGDGILIASAFRLMPGSHRSARSSGTPSAAPHGPDGAALGRQ